MKQNNNSGGVADLDQTMKLRTSECSRFSIRRWKKKWRRKQWRTAGVWTWTVAQLGHQGRSQTRLFPVEWRRAFSVEIRDYEDDWPAAYYAQVDLWSLHSVNNSDQVCFLPISLFIFLYLFILPIITERFPCRVIVNHSKPSPKILFLKFESSNIGSSTTSKCSFWKSSILKCYIRITWKLFWGILGQCTFSPQWNFL